jgi:hypothetical protein
MTAPTLDGYVTADGIHVAVWCKHCRMLHIHGHRGRDEPIGYGDGHVASDCIESPDVGGGYYIREVGWFTSEPQERRYLREQAKIATAEVS